MHIMHATWCNTAVPVYWPPEPSWRKSDVMRGHLQVFVSSILNYCLLSFGASDLRKKLEYVVQQPRPPDTSTSFYWAFYIYSKCSFTRPGCDSLDNLDIRSISVWQITAIFIWVTGHMNEISFLSFVKMRERHRLNSVQYIFVIFLLEWKYKCEKISLFKG